MAIPIIESSSSATATASSVAPAKPTGLAVDDLMVALVSGYDAGANNYTHTTPSGWTVIEKQATGDIRPAAYYKIADSADVAASTFTFVMSGAQSQLSAAILRVTDHIVATPVNISEVDVTLGSISNVDFTTALTPHSNNSVFVVLSVGATTNMTGSPASISTYTSTPSNTYTEAEDFGGKDGLSDGHAISVSHFDYTGLTEITARGGTISETVTIGKAGIALFINGAYNQTGTNALLEVSPSTFAQSGSCDTHGTSTLHEVTPTIPTQSGFVDTPTQWTEPTKESTTWTEPDK